MNKSTTEQKTTKDIILEYIQHNPRHYLKINIKGKEIHPCARCFGLWVGALIGFIFASPFWLGFVYIDNFNLIFSIAWLLALPCIIDWSTVKIGLRKGNNYIRILTGFLYGLGAIVYIFVLPANILLKIGSYALYEGIFYIIRKEYKLTHLNK